MPGYDWSFGGWQPRGAGGYEWGRPPRETMGRGQWDPRDVRYGRWDGPGRYDRGVYGDAYEGYSPGDRERMGPRSRQGYGREYGDAWQAGYARGPFLPEQAYRRHPELDREPGPRGDRWGYEMDDAGYDRSDAQILDGVRRRLYEDVWLDVERIDVEVEDGVVTLRGEVDDFLEVRYAWDDAWETEGVRGVVTQLAVRADEPQREVHGDLVPQTTQGTRSEPEDTASR